MKMAKILNFPKADKNAPITHKNFKGKTYYLHQGKTKTGNPNYQLCQSHGQSRERR
jgi:hypothetical protein